MVTLYLVVGACLGTLCGAIARQKGAPQANCVRGALWITLTWPALIVIAAVALYRIAAEEED